MRKEAFTKEVLLELTLEGQERFFQGERLTARVNSICRKYMHAVELLFWNYNSSVYWNIENGQ